MRTVIYVLAICIALCSIGRLQAQTVTTFRKGTLLIGLTEGGTYTRYTTVAPPNDNNGNNNVRSDGNVKGDRDPLCLEYGITDRFGLGISMGGDVLRLNTDKYYNFQSVGKTSLITSEITADLNYHFYTSRKADFSAYLSMGLASVMLKSSDGEHNYKYEATGSIARLGGRARYYFTRRLGVVGMVSVFTASMSSFDVKTNTAATGYQTNIKGWAFELGPCVRLLK